MHERRTGSDERSRHLPDGIMRQEVVVTRLHSLAGLRIPERGYAIIPARLLRNKHLKWGNVTKPFNKKDTRLMNG